jgi:colanic acid biosynthesis glycosyl transferase WcaI
MDPKGFSGAGTPYDDAVMIVFLVNRYFWPDESATSLLLTDLAEDLRALGHEVHVFTSRQLYDRPRAQLPEHQIWQGIQIHRLNTSRFGRRHFWGRLLDIITFHLALRYSKKITVTPDAWFVMTDPPLLLTTVLKLRSQLGGRVIHHVDDVYPDLAMALGSLPPQGLISSLLDGWVKEGLKDCDQVLALGDCMARVLKQKGAIDDRLAITPPWADGSKLYPLNHAENGFRREIGIPLDHVVVMYSGNMGLGHRFETILAAVRSLAPLDTVHFVFIGDGAKKPQIDGFRRAHNLKNIMMLPYQPRARLRETLSASDIHLISLDAKVQGFIVPSKFAGILAVGRPTVFLGDQENSIAAAIFQHHCGYVIPEGDVGTLVEIITRLTKDPEHRSRLGEFARNLFEKEYDRRVVVPKIIAKIGSNAHNNKLGLLEKSLISGVSFAG